MLILELFSRTISGNGALEFPAHVKLRLELEPAEIFGRAKISGQFPLLPVGKQWRFTYNSFTGAVQIEVDECNCKLEVNENFMGIPVQISGNSVTVNCQLSSKPALLDLILTLEHFLPAALSATVPAAIWVTSISGTIGGVEFRYRYEGKRQHLFDPVFDGVVNTRISDRLQALTACGKKATRLLSAHRYLLQSRRLTAFSGNPAFFLGERLLNLSKAVEVIFRADADRLRSQLASIEIEPAMAELFVSLLYIRNEVDVAHPAISPLRPSEVEQIQWFTERCESSVGWLLWKVTDAVASGKLSLPESQDRRKRSRIIEIIESNQDVVRAPFRDATYKVLIDHSCEKPKGSSENG